MNRGTVLLEKNIANSNGQQQIYTFSFFLEITFVTLIHATPIELHLLCKQKYHKENDNYY